MKKVNWKYGFLLLFALLTAGKAGAQDDVEYRMEIGAGAGLLGYQGDFSGSLTKNLQPAGNVVMRYNMNPYMGFKANLTAGKLKGDSKVSDTYYPDYAETTYSFDNTLVGLDIAYEYNFWPYGTGREYRGAKKITPYVTGGIGGVYVKSSEKNTFTGSLPLGLGVKYKAGSRVNIVLEAAMHFTLSDKLDGVEDPYWVKSSGIFKNTDCYSTVQISVTYSFMPKCRTCHNEDE